MTQTRLQPYTSAQRLLIIILIGLVLLGGFAVRTWRLNEESIWHDEGWSIRAIRGPFTTPDDNTPYVYYATMHLLWKLGSGETPFAFRYGSVLLGLLTVAVAIRLGWRWYGLGSGLVTGVLVGVSPLLWEYAQEVRAYVFVPLFALLMIDNADRLLWYKIIDVIPRRLWATLFSIELIGIYTHNLVVPLIVWLNVALGCTWLWRRDIRRLLIWGGLQFALVLSYLPWLATQSPSGTPLNTTPQWGVELAKDIWYSYFLPVLAQVQDTNNDLWLNLAALSLIVLSFILISTERTRRTWLLTSHVVFVPILSAILIRVANIDFHPRYFVASVPATLLLGVGGLFSLEHIGGNRLEYVGMGAVALLAMAQSYDSLKTIADTRIYQHDDFEGLANYYATLPDDAIILIPFNREPSLQDYYARQKNIRATFVNIPLYASEERAISELQTVIDAKNANDQLIEFLTWFQLPADVRGMYPCLLSGSSTEIGEPQSYFGLNTQAFVLTGVPQFAAIDRSPQYGEVTLRELGWLSSPQAVCIRTQWGLERTMDEDFSVAMRILNPYGGILVDDDAVIRNDDQVSTQKWADDEQGATYHTLYLPPATPLGDYGLSFTIYSPSMPNGLDVFAENGSPLGVIYRLPEMISAQGLPLYDPPYTSYLVADNTASTYMLDSGTTLEATLLLVADDDFKDDISVRLIGENWEIEQQVEFTNDGDAQLSWHVFPIPPDASGDTELIVDDTTVTTYHIHQVERIWETPEFETPVHADFPGIGELVGVTVDHTMFTSGQALNVTLIWRAENTTTIPYTVFVHLRDPDVPVGNPLAQSDRQPAQNSRPTTGWVTDEYIIDNHQLDLGVEEYEGAAYIIVGLYDATTFENVKTADGQDFVRLPINVTIVSE
jgi:hypothetical protein